MKKPLEKKKTEMNTNMTINNLESDRSEILQNLYDAGCDAKTIQKYIKLQNEGKKQEQLRLLSQQRRNLLHVVHENQKRIDCLDYLIHRVETNEQ